MIPLLRQVRRGALLVGVLFVTAVSGHQLITNRPLIDSVYWTVVTISTVGYSNEPPPEMGVAEKVFTIGVILVGTVALTYILGVVLQIAIEGQFEKALGVRRMNKEIARLQNHIIICGYGRMGQQLAKRLARHGKPLVVIDGNHEVLAEGKADGHLVLEGDATDEEVLEEAGIARASTVVVALHGDAENVYLTLTARNMNPQVQILARGELLATEKKLRQAGANQVVLPAVIGAHRMADLIVRPHAARLMYGAGHAAAIDASMEELTLVLGSPLIGKTIRDAEMRQKHRVLIVAVRRAEGELIFNPDANVDFRSGDTLVVIGQGSDVGEFLKIYGTA